MSEKSYKIYIEDLAIIDQMNDIQAGQLFRTLFYFMKNRKLPDNVEFWLVMATAPFIRKFEEDRKKNRLEENHWNWKGGITSQNHKIRQSLLTKEWRKSVFTRDKYTCKKCYLIGGKLHAHHKKEFSKYPKLRFDLDNGITLCVKCHRHIHSKVFDQSKPSRFF